MEWRLRLKRCVLEIRTICKRQPCRSLSFFHFISFKVKCMSCSHLHVTLLPSIQIHANVLCCWSRKVHFDIAKKQQQRPKSNWKMILFTLWIRRQCESCLCKKQPYSTFEMKNFWFQCTRMENVFCCCTFLHDKISFYGCLFFHSVVCVRALFFVLLNEFVCHLIWANKPRVFVCRELNAVLLFIY